MKSNHGGYLFRCILVC